jgi:uroporphyrinogen III methyltransferase/synthase
VTTTSKKDTPGRSEQDPAAAKRAAQPGLAAFVGTGPGSPELLTVRAAGLLGRADLMFASAEVTDRVRHLLPATADLRDLAELDADPRVLVKAVKAGQLAVVAYDGDPLLFGSAAAAAAACAKARVRFEIAPGMPAATAVPAYAGIPLTSEAGGDVRILHAAEVSRLSAEAQPSRSLVILGVEAGPADLAKMLMAAGWPERTPFTITWNGTTTEQLTIRCALGSVTADLKAAGVSLLTETGPAVGVVGEAAAAQQDLSWYESKPLFGWRVLVPRTKDQAGSVSERLRAYGAVPQEVPTIAVEPPRSPTQMERAVKGLVDGRYQWVVFTSTNAVRAVWEKFAEFGLDARAFSGVKIACVGAATAEKVRAFGINPELVPSIEEAQESSSEGLLGIFPPYDDVLDPVDRVLLPRADIATETLAAGLRDRGWEIDDVTAYRTVRAAPPPAPIREAIKTGGFDAVCFTSSSTVRNLVGIAGKPHARTIVACIGPQTAETAREFGLRVDVQPDEARVPALVDALAAHAARLRAEGALPPPRKAKARRR